MHRLPVLLVIVAAAVLGPVARQANAESPRSGGVLTVTLREDLAQGFATHESSTNSTTYPALPCLNNLVIFASHQGGAVLGAAMVAKPYGVWGLTEKDLNALPGYGRPDEMKARARKLLAEAGITPGRPLRVEMATRAIPNYVDMASYVINELRQVGIEATLRQVETAQWHPLATRGDYQIGANLTGVGVDDPDANFFENYGCGSPRNYSQYCDERLMKRFEQQSAELDPKKRLGMVIDIQKQLEQEAVRPILAQRLDFFAHWPHVKGLVAQHSVYNFTRFQDVWWDR